MCEWVHCRDVRCITSNPYLIMSLNFFLEHSIHCSSLDLWKNPENFDFRHQITPPPVAGGARTRKALISICVCSWLAFSSPLLQNRQYYFTKVTETFYVHIEKNISKKVIYPFYTQWCRRRGGGILSIAQFPTPLKNNTFLFT